MVAPVETDPVLSKLFRGVSIHVNGYTEPSHSVLKQMMAQYGGSFQNYYSRSTVTHIVCSNLPDAKVKQFEKERDPTPIVRPEWVTESIRARRLLSIDRFILYRLRPGGPGQQTLVDSLSIGKKRSPYDENRLAQALVVAQKLRQNCEVLKGPPKSSRDDPNFVESFYRASRLHFIGTWKTRVENLMESGIADEAPTPSKPGPGNERAIIHVDMDCFFASVAETSHPIFKGLPLAVCHSNAKGSGEISSANYEARKYGIHASMFMSRAKELCPQLIVVPYEFDKYEVVSESMYRILFRYSSRIQPVSCDEAYLDVTGLGDPSDIARKLRNDIEKETGCRASAGIGPNMILARIATAKAKPNGQFFLPADNALHELGCLDVEELPGIGWVTGTKLREAGFQVVADIQNSTQSKIQEIIGQKAGTIAYKYAFGQDVREVGPPPSRKSVGAEINWGIRFESQDDAERFLHSIASQIHDRLDQIKMKGKNITLKIKKKQTGWVEPVKYLGMGRCDSLSKSIALNRGVFSTQDIYTEALALLQSLHVTYSDIRGMGLSMTKLEPRVEKQGQAERHNHASPTKPLNKIDRFTVPKQDAPSPKKTFEDESNKIRHPPSILHSSIDPTVFQELPKDIQKEIELHYGLHANRFKKNKLPVSMPKAKRKIAPVTNDHHYYEPLRMSQIDTSVLHELPESVQQEILKSIDPTKKNRKKRNAAKGTRTTDHKSTNTSEQYKVRKRELEEAYTSLVVTLPPLLVVAAECLHAGNVASAIANLQTWLSRHQDAEHLETFKRLVCLEFESNVSDVFLEHAWVLCRGIHRIINAAMPCQEAMQDILHSLLQKIRDRYNIYVKL